MGITTLEESKDESLFEKVCNACYRPIKKAALEIDPNAKMESWRMHGLHGTAKYITPEGKKFKIGTYTVQVGLAVKLITKCEWYE